MRLKWADYVSLRGVGCWLGVGVGVGVGEGVGVVAVAIIAASDRR